MPCGFYAGVTRGMSTTALQEVYTLWSYYYKEIMLRLQRLVALHGRQTAPGWFYTPLYLRFTFLPA